MTIYTNCATRFYAYYKMFCCYSNMFSLTSMSNCPVVVAILEFVSIHLISLLIRVPIEVRKYFDIIDIHGNPVVWEYDIVSPMPDKAPPKRVSVSCVERGKYTARLVNKTRWMPRPSTR